jgi:hypothetical protein
MDGWYLGSFVHRAFKELRSEKSSASQFAMRATEEEEETISR